MYSGGIADKLGNRYEAKWLVRQLLDIIGDKAQSLRFEGLATAFQGFEFSVQRNGHTEWHQTKVNNPNGNWTLKSLSKEGVLAAFKSRLQAADSDRCFFISQDPAKDLYALAGKAKMTSSIIEYQESLGDGHSQKFVELMEIWSVDAEIAYRWLKRCEFRTESQSAIESAIVGFSDLYFFKPEGVFEYLREFMEARINKEITTEIARADLRSEKRLILKDWSLDPSLLEQLSKETTAYLATYNPFGVKGFNILRSQTEELLDFIKDPSGPTVVLLTGVAGSGKSGVIRGLIEKLIETNIPHLAFRIDQHLDCKTPRMLGKAIMSREESPVSTLKGIAPNKLSVLIVDQMDAVSEASGRNGNAKQAVLRLIDDAHNFGSIRIVISCRTFDLESDQKLKALRGLHDVRHVDVPLLSWEKIEPLLVKESIDVSQFSNKQKELLCLPLNLSIFFEVHEGSELAFQSRNDLFSRLIEKKSRAIRIDRSISWDVLSPLSKLAEWMSDQQKLDAPQDTIQDFPGALDLLSSEGLIVQSRGHVNFFHESLFDYIYARTFSARAQSLETFLKSTEQHLFRRTQVRQILDMIRQNDEARYFQELKIVLSSGDVRYHIKVAVAQWLGSIFDPKTEEKDIVLGLDPMSERFPPLIRYVFFSSHAWFDRLFQDGWIAITLSSSKKERVDSVLWWLCDIGGKRPIEVASLLNDWWDGQADNGEQLLNFFRFVKRQTLDDALVDLCCQLVRSNPTGLFKRGRGDHNFFLRKWAVEFTPRAADVLDAYFDAWFAAHPNKHPFEQDEFEHLDSHSLAEVAKRAPEAFVYGTISAFIRSIELIRIREAEGTWDYSFKRRVLSGHHFRSDVFVNMFRQALREIAISAPEKVVGILAQIDFTAHEVCTHLWLETIGANATALHHLIMKLLSSPYLFRAGWQGAEWKSFADAAKRALPHLKLDEPMRVEEAILAHRPELVFAGDLARKILAEGERSFHNRRSVIAYLNRSGYEQWCILENIGDRHLTQLAQNRLLELRRKFCKLKTAEPVHAVAGWVRSPIARASATHLNDAQWLRAMNRYNDDEGWSQNFNLDGGPSQLAGELQHLVKEQPVRFDALLDRIPDTAHRAYVGGILSGLAEVADLDDGILCHAIFNAHSRPGNLFGNEIARLFSRHPKMGRCPSALDVLIWYVKYGEANDDEEIDASNTEREIATIEDLLRNAGTIHIRGINGARGWAAEALGNVLWEVPEASEKLWPVLESRANSEPSISVRCCLTHPAVALYNLDRKRFAGLITQLSKSPCEKSTWRASLFKTAWRLLAFPNKKVPGLLKAASIRCALFVSYFVSRSSKVRKMSQWWAPLLTHHAVNIFPYLLHSEPKIAKELLFVLVTCGDASARLIAAWQVFRMSFQDNNYAPLADAFAREGPSNRRLLADLASQAAIHEEFRYRAEKVLRECFTDDDQEVQRQSADVFRKIQPGDFLRYRDLALEFITSSAFKTSSWAFFDGLENAECKVDDIVICATEKLIDDIKCNGNPDRFSSELHQVQDIIKKEYAASEFEPALRRRLLNVIDDMLFFELYGVDTIISAHER